MGFLGGLLVKNTPINAGDTGLIPRSRRSLGEGKGNPLQYSYLENSMDRGAWQATVLGVTKSQTSLSSTSICSVCTHTHTHTHTHTIDRLKSQTSLSSTSICSVCTHTHTHTHTHYRLHHCVHTHTHTHYR